MKDSEMKIIYIGIIIGLWFNFQILKYYFGG